ncbi:MAG: VOC family protein [Actinomycetota bacterium]|nr:VOC family protein [Actinomycetota bacterium]
MKIKELGYLGVRCPYPEEWLRFGLDVLGMQGSMDATGQVQLRMDEHRQRIMVEAGDSSALAWVGWDVADHAGLTEARADLAAAGVAVHDGTVGDCESRGVTAMIWFDDPAANRVELFWGPTGQNPFVSARPGLGGFDTTHGLPHLALVVPDLDAAVAFYQGPLGFDESDRISGPFEARFLRINDRHHSLVLFEGERCAVDHLLVEVSDIHDLGAALDAARTAGFEPAVSVGYHPPDAMLSCYFPTPAGFRIEYGITLAGRQSPPWGHVGLLASVGATTITPGLAGTGR